jgi:hypothetical protein
MEMKLVELRVFGENSRGISTAGARGRRPFNRKINNKEKV